MAANPIRDPLQRGQILCGPAAASHLIPKRRFPRDRSGPTHIVWLARAAAPIPAISSPRTGMPRLGLLSFSDSAFAASVLVEAPTALEAAFLWVSVVTGPRFATVTVRL